MIDENQWISNLILIYPIPFHISGTFPLMRALKIISIPLLKPNYLLVFIIILSSRHF